MKEWSGPDVEALRAAFERASERAAGEDRPLGEAPDRARALGEWRDAVLAREAAESRLASLAEGTPPIADPPPVLPEPAAPKHPFHPRVNVHELLEEILGRDESRHLDSLRRLPPLGERVPSFEEKGPVSRVFCRAVSWVVLRLARFLTGPQRRANALSLALFEESDSGMARLSEAAVVLNDWVSVERERLDGEIRTHRAALDGLRQRVEELTRGDEAQATRQGLADAQTRLLEQEKRLADLRVAVAWNAVVTTERADFESLSERLARVEERLERLAAMRSTESASAHPAAVRTEDGSMGRSLREARFADLYLDLEDVFRGPRELVKERLLGYLSLIGGHEVGTPTRPVVDLGCGRGEWLQLLRERGVEAVGVEVSAAACRRCRQEGIDVVEGDALGYLESLADRSVGAVTAFHLLEHLPLESVLRLFEESFRVLAPGGFLLVETPNPENIVVGASSFYLDPTHLRPLAPAVLEFHAKSHGFVGLDIRRLSDHRPSDPRLEPVADGVPGAAAVNPLLDFLRQHFDAAPDYALIARKPG